MPTLMDIADASQPVDSATTGATVFERFQREPDAMAIAVVDEGGRPVGLVERHAFFLKLAAEYGRALYARRPIVAVMDRAPLVVDAATEVEVFTRYALTHRPSDLLKGFIVAKDGVYVGVGSALSLLQAVNAQNERRAKDMALLADDLAIAGRKADDARRRLREAVDAMPDSLALFDEQDRLVLWNAKYAELHPECPTAVERGVTFTDLIRSTAKAVILPPDESEEAFVARRIGLHSADRGSHEQALKDGRWLRVEERRTPSGGAVSVCVDITDLKRSEASFRVLFEENPAPMWLASSGDLRILQMNAAALRFFRLAPEQAKHRSIFELVMEEDREELNDIQLGGGREHYHGDRPWRCRLGDGEEAVVLPYARRIETDGEPVVLLTVVDITERMRSEAEVQRTRALLDAVIDSVPSMLFVKDVETDAFAVMNRPAEALVGMHRTRAVGCKERDLLPASLADAFEKQDQDLKSGQTSSALSEQAVTLTDGADRILSTRRIPIPRFDGGVAYMLTVADDVTEARAASVELERARDAAEAANRAKTQFLANMSHEIRTPLNGVLGIAGVLARSDLDERQRELVEIIESSADSLQQILSDVLDIARVEAGRLAIEPQPFDLPETLRSFVALSELRAREKALGFALRIGEDVRPQVVGDASRLKQIIGNLLSNAIKFTETGAITVSATAEMVEGVQQVTIEVTDTGVGIAPDVVPELFERFSQGDGSTTRRFGGSGLGLAISRDLARLMGGDLTVSSTLGIGSRFTLRLPLPETEASIEPQARREPVPERNLDRRAQILLAEDNATNRKVVQLILEQMDVDLTCVENGAQAVEALDRQAYDLVLMDLQMPVMGGLEAMAAIRAREKLRGQASTPIVVLSANAMPEDVRRSLDAGAQGHVAKPISANALMKGVAEALTAAAAATTEADPALSRVAG